MPEGATDLAGIDLAGIDAIRALIGQPPVHSGWRLIDQPMIDAFAAATGDHQWIHVDPARAAGSPYGATIAHGFLSLSLLSMFFGECYRFPTRKMGVNYGFDRLRFTAAVPVNSELRGSFALAECEEIGPAAIRTAWDTRIEIAGSDKPALVARWLVQMMF